MPSWNAYKVFNNGKRAKIPYTTFEAEETQHFFDSILPTLGAKFQKAKWVILDSGASQEREQEVINQEIEEFEKQKNKVLSILAARKFPELCNKKVEVCLSMNKQIGWKWAWCIVETASHVHLGEISERFDNSARADQWIKEQIECMAST